MPNIHPMMVHFPVALIVTAVICDIIYLFNKKQMFVDTGTILSIAAVIGAAMAVVSGLLAEESVKLTSAAHELVERHELFGFISLGIISVLTVIRIALRDSLHIKTVTILVAVGITASLLVGYTAHMGGELVFEYGAGVETVSQPNPADSGLKPYKPHETTPAAK